MSRPAAQYRNCPSSCIDQVAAIYLRHIDPDLRLLLLGEDFIQNGVPTQGFRYPVDRIKGTITSVHSSVLASTCLSQKAVVTIHITVGRRDHKESCAVLYMICS